MFTFLHFSTGWFNQNAKVAAINPRLKTLKTRRFDDVFVHTILNGNMVCPEFLYKLNLKVSVFYFLGRLQRFLFLCLHTICTLIVPCADFPRTRNLVIDRNYFL